MVTFKAQGGGWRCRLPWAEPHLANRKEGGGGCSEESVEEHRVRGPLLESLRIAVFTWGYSSDNIADICDALPAEGAVSLLV